MNWKSEAIDHLNRYPAMVQAVKNIPREIAMLEQDAEGLKGNRPDLIAGSGQAGPRDDVLIGNIVKRQALKNALEHARLWVKATEGALSVLTTEGALSVLTTEEKLVLERMYIYPEKGVINRLCGELGLEQSSIYRRRDDALYRFTIALYGAS